jgi:hypothetical protein
MSQPNLKPVAAIPAAAVLIAGPVAAALVRLFDPATSPTESIAKLVADAAAHPAAAHAVLVADSFIWLMLPASLIAAWVAWRRAPVLGAVAGVLLLAGWAGVVALAAQDALIVQASHAGFGRAEAVALTTAWANGGVVNTYTTMFVAGHLLGTILLGLALWRGRTIPRWIALGVAVSMPLHLVAFVAAIEPLDLAAYALLLIGFGACAVKLLRETAARGSAERAAGMAVA